MGGKELLSAEGTTLGYPVAMSLNAVSLQPLIAQLKFIRIFVPNGFLVLR